MKVPLYILGFLMRYGPQHGYLLRRHIEEEASDFALIRTSNIYYHLERLKKDGYVDSEIEREGRRPDRQVFRITEKGQRHFLTLLQRATENSFRGEYLFDATLFFFEYIDNNILIRSLKEQIDICKNVLNHIEKHQKGILAHIPKEYVKPAHAVFNHHIYHYQAELKWLEETLASLEGG
jgi:DNA-binding PadR family transcriptional regulator